MKDDLISREAAILIASGYCHPANIAKELAKLPSAQPGIDEWCTDCKEHDKVNHCCPRFNRVIKKAVEDLKSERKTGRWIDKNGNIVSPFWERYECSVCGARSDNYNYCPNCGADMREGETDD